MKFRFTLKNNGHKPLIMSAESLHIKDSWVTRLKEAIILCGSVHSHKGGDQNNDSTEKVDDEETEIGEVHFT